MTAWVKLVYMYAHECANLNYLTRSRLCLCPGLELYSTCLWHLKKQVGLDRYSRCNFAEVPYKLWPCLQVELSFLAQDAMGMNKLRPEIWCASSCRGGWGSEEVIGGISSSVSNSGVYLSCVRVVVCS